MVLCSSHAPGNLVTQRQCLRTRGSVQHGYKYEFIL
ncbi:Uncharacterised protein [uncultured Blautia sp.]|nr:Uncharacterised protein [uncultured Blautia sp.]